jgi:hypothetical protein
VQLLVAHFLAARFPSLLARNEVGLAAAAAAKATAAIAAAASCHANELS